MRNLTRPVEKIELWPTLVYVYQYRDWPFDKKKILDVIEAEEKLQQKDIDSGVAEAVKTKGLKESKFDLLKKKDKYPVLGKLEEFFCESVASLVTQELPSHNQRFNISNHAENITPVIFESWYHKTNNSGAHNLHAHPGASWAGIFYVNSKECDIKNNNGVNRFHNIHSIHGPGDLGSLWWNQDSIFGLQPVEGQLVLFPAWVYHEATPYTGQEDRVVISFNSVVIGKKSDEGTAL